MNLRTSTGPVADSFRLVEFPRTPGASGPIWINPSAVVSVSQAPQGTLIRVMGGFGPETEPVHVVNCPVTEVVTKLRDLRVEA